MFIYISCHHEEIRKFYESLPISSNSFKQKEERVNAKNHHSLLPHNEKSIEKIMHEHIESETNKQKETLPLKNIETLLQKTIS